MLGTFALEAMEARGASGAVWRAHHQPTGTLAAVKVLSPPTSEPQRRLIAAEIRAVAALNHPNVVWVYEQGVVPPAQATDQLAAGSPYLVMEYAAGGSLRTQPPEDWATLRGVLLPLLDALAHCHARGVVHRDIKPHNLLRDGRGQPLLADFGLGAFIGEAAPQRLRAGTPAYMAPEQLDGRWSDIGPWTDLYALAGTVYAIVSGRPPFVEADVANLRAAHLYRPPPALRPQFPVPSALEGWLRKALAKSPRDRFASAAEAAHALPPADAVDLLAGGSPRPPSRSAPTQTLTLDATADEDGTIAAPTAPMPEASPVPLPESWRQPRWPRYRPRLHGTGRSLLAVRQVPLIGREAERDRLWAALGQRGPQPRLVGLTGPGGVGKRRLAAWLCTRAAELGIARPIRIRAASDARNALERGLWDALRCPDSLPALRRALADLWPEASASWRLLWALLRPDAAPDVRPPPSRERCVVLLQALQRFSPLPLLWVDGAPDTSTLDFVAHLRQQGIDSMVLFSSMPPEEAEQVALAPLPQPDLIALLQEGPGLTPALAAQLAAQAGGIPLLALETARSGIAQGTLLPAPGGFRLAEGTSLQIPASLASVWMQRLGRALEGVPAPSRVVLEAAAVLGGEITPARWRALCVVLDAATAPEPSEPLLESGLAERTHTGGWRFSHELLRQGLHQSAGARLPALHRACAAVLADQAAPDARWRRGLHLLRGQRAEAAIPLLMAGVTAAFAASDHATAEGRQLWVQRALEDAGIPETDPRYGELWVARARSAGAQGRLDEAEAHLRAAWAHPFGAAVQVAATQAAGVVAQLRGDLATAAQLQADACAQADALGDPRLLVRSLNSRGWLLLRMGDLPAAGSCFSAAVAQGEAAGDRAGAMDAAFALAYIALHRGALDKIPPLLERARGHAAVLGARVGLAQADNFAGEVARLQGDPDAAARAYAAAWQQYAELEREEAALARCNLGLARLDQGRLDAARAHLRAALLPTGRDSQVIHILAARPESVPVLQSAVGLTVHLGLLRCAALEREAESWAVHRGAVQQILAHSAMAAPDFLRMAQRAAEAARTAGWADRATEADAVAAVLLETLQEQGWTGP